ncbi:MAG: methionyl-tRNA formyltransferase [Methanocorpusculum sp.]|uniref:methionyl-tRNA formyltransferase n=1 Tax=Methanocorpusculum sp. TaxID=2058474 RepID=UPI0027174C7A|nr:methionyl-tRNA formyltransferase [Methanocorpusculum sp.]MDO9523009.1 methionyl-tRNA formyltransferase [Methanocorpusculum sp.]
MRVLFMGTPEYALSSLRAVFAEHEIVGILTRVDKPNRRGNRIEFSPVKVFALEHGIPVFQPEDMKDPALFEQLKALSPDISVVVAFGMMIPDSIIDLPKHNTINLHGSLLPKYRGAAPMQYSVLNGDSETGVSIMYVTARLDAGDVILSKSIPLDENASYGEVHDLLADLGAEALIKALELVESGQVTRTPQDDLKVTFAPSISKEECVIDWSLPAGTVHNRIRGLSPIPGANTRLPDGKLMKIYKSEKVFGDYTGEPGTVVDVIKKKGPVVMTGGGAVCILSAKPEGKREMPGFEIVNGHYLKVGDSL